MRGRLVIAGLVLFAFGSVPVLCQTSPAPAASDSALYLSFFQEAAHQSAAAHTVSLSQPLMLNGQPTGLIQPELIQPSMQDFIGINDREAQSVVDASAGCLADINSLDAGVRALVFETRLRAANDDKPSDALAERLKELEVKRVQIVLDHVQRLKGSLGEASFKLVDEYVRVHANGGSFFPVVPARKL
jgi:hypothetical protein